MNRFSRVRRKCEKNASTQEFTGFGRIKKQCVRAYRQMRLECVGRNSHTKAIHRGYVRGLGLQERFDCTFQRLQDLLLLELDHLRRTMMMIPLQSLLRIRGVVDRKLFSEWIIEDFTL